LTAIKEAQGRRAHGLRGRRGFKFMEAILTRAGLWFGAMVLAVLAAAYAHDSGFAAQMMIVAVVALVGLWVSVAKADVGAVASGILRMPTDPSRYDDDPVRWGVLATVFWSIVGMLAGVLIACQLAWPQLNVEPYLTSAVCVRCIPRAWCSRSAATS
jgi:cytochrome c oxidase cbb3-type subunit I